MSSRCHQQKHVPTDFVQASASYTRRGTLRGLHYQAEPFAEAKLVRCTAGALFDVIVDVRPGSPSFGRWQSLVLSAENRITLFVPPGCPRLRDAEDDSTRSTR